LDEASALGALAHAVIDDEGDVGVGADVAIFRRALHVEAGDVDRVQGRVVPVADRLVLGGAVGTDRGQPGPAAGGQVLDVVRVDGHQASNRVLPSAARDSIARWASAARSSGNLWPMIGRSGGAAASTRARCASRLPSSRESWTRSMPVSVILRRAASSSAICAKSPAG